MCESKASEEIAGGRLISLYEIDELAVDAPDADMIPESVAAQREDALQGMMNDTYCDRG